MHQHWHLSLLVLSDAWLKKKLCDSLWDRAVLWPAHDCASSISKFNTEGYMSCPFPILLPAGAADYFEPRQVKIQPINDFKYLTMYHNVWFPPKPMIQIFCSEHWNVLAYTTEWQDIQSPTPECCKTKHRCLRDMFGCEGEAFSNRVMHFATTLRGTRQYWFRQHGNIIAMMDTIVLLTVFFYSALQMFSGPSWHI